MRWKFRNDKTAMEEVRHQHRWKLENWITDLKLLREDSRMFGEEN